MSMKIPTWLIMGAPEKLNSRLRREVETLQVRIVVRERRRIGNEDAELIHIPRQPVDGSDGRRDSVAIEIVDKDGRHLRSDRIPVVYGVRARAGRKNRDGGAGRRGIRRGVQRAVAIENVSLPRAAAIHRVNAWR